MARQLRIAFPGKTYHITSRGDRQEAIYRSDGDRMLFLDILGRAIERHGARALAYCLMGNHYHLVLRTDEGNISRVMRHVNGVYTQAFNHRHELTGHVFQGRFHAVLIERDAHLLEACRYVELNPVRARLVDDPGAWRWSSYLDHVGVATRVRWFDAILALELLVGRDVDAPDTRRLAAGAYARFVAAGHGADAPDGATPAGAFLRGNHAKPPQASSVALWRGRGLSRNEAIFRAYRDDGASMATIARSVGLSVSRVSRLIAAFDPGTRGGG